MIVAPGTAALAAAVTLDAAPSVSSVSPGPWATAAGFIRLADALELAVLELEVDAAPEPAAPAMWDPARMPPATGLVGMSGPRQVTPRADEERNVGRKRRRAAAWATSSGAGFRSGGRGGARGVRTNVSTPRVG